MFCEKCNDSGIIFIEKDGREVAKVCDCVKKKQSLASIEKSGFGGLLDKYSFDHYKADFDFQKEILDKARVYLTEQENKWFVLVGESGSGKSHICTSICKHFLDKNRQVRFISWIDVSTKLKQSVTDGKTYNEIINELKDCEVLYIDDFWKSNNNTEPTNADIKLANEIINYRYNKSMRNEFTRTILSSERLVRQMIEYDSAVAGRLVECAGKYLTQIIGKEKNYRLKDFY